MMKKHLMLMKSFLAKEPDPAYRRRAEIILSNIKGRKILEVGCGRGFYLRAIKKLYPGVEIMGVDKNKKYIKGLPAIEADAQKLPFRSNSFETVVASEILEHVDDDQKVLTEIYRVVKKKGQVIITVPSANYPLLWDPANWLLERIFKIHLPADIWWLSGIWADHQRLYQEKELIKKVKKAGFEVGKVWRTTRWCLPFSHFLFYGIGKNLVERGVLKSFNRFENKRPGLLSKILLTPVRWVDNLNRRSEEEGKATVNLAVLAVKSF